MKKEEKLQSEAYNLFVDTKYKQAIKAFNKLVSNDPENIDNIISLAYCYIFDLQHENALELFKTLQIKEPLNTEILNGIGLCYHGQKKYDASLKVYDKLLDVDPQNANCYFNRSEVFIDMGLYEEAISSLNAYLIFDPDNQIALNNKAYTLMLMENDDEAMDLFTKIIKKNPEYSNPYFHRAKIYLKREQLNQAVYDLRRASILGISKAFAKLETLSFKHRQNALYSAIYFLKSKDVESLGRPLKIKNYEQVCKNLETLSLPAMENTFWMDYFIHDGLTYDGVEIFSVAPNAYKENGFYTLPDIFEQNRYYHEYYSESENFKPDFLFMGKTDEDLIVYDVEADIYHLMAREDLMIYKSYASLQELLSDSWQVNLLSFYDDKHRQDFLNEAQKFMKEYHVQVPLFEKLEKAVHKEIVKEVNERQKIPISFDSIYLTNDLSAIAILSEPRHVYIQPLFLRWDVSENTSELMWYFEKNEKYSFDLSAYFNTEDIVQLQNLMLSNSDKNMAYYSFKAGIQYLKFGSELAWKDTFADIREKYRKTSTFFEKAAALDAEYRFFFEKLKTTFLFEL